MPTYFISRLSPSKASKAFNWCLCQGIFYNHGQHWQPTNKSRKIGGHTDNHAIRKKDSTSLWPNHSSLFCICARNYPTSKKLCKGKRFPPTAPILFIITQPWHDTWWPGARKTSFLNGPSLLSFKSITWKRFSSFKRWSSGGTVRAQN